MSSSHPVWINDGLHNLEIARFVIQGDPFVNHLVAQATDELRILTHYEHWGFAAAVQDGSTEVLSAAVEALYLHLMADHQLFYEFELAYNVATGEQHIQLPAVTAQVRKGTCIDLALLFLSCLAQAKLPPVYIQLTRPGGGHALSATWITPPEDRKESLTLNEVREHLRANRLLAVDCTGFVKGFPGRQYRVPFQEAQDQARQQVEDLSWDGWAVDIERVWGVGKVPPIAPVVPPHQPWAATRRGADPEPFRLTIHPFAAHIREKTRGFVGRKWVFDEIDRHLQDREKLPSGYILITGEPGIGKSAVAAHLVKQRGLVHHFNIRPDNICSPKAFLTNVCAQLIVHYKLPHDRLPDDAHENAQFLSRLLQEVCERQTSGTPLVLVIDALDEAERSGSSNPLFLPSSLPDGVYIVATTRPGDQYRVSAARVRNLLLDGRTRENQADVREYIGAHREKKGVRQWITGHALEPEKFSELMVEKSQGNFMYLYHVLQDMEQNKFGDFSPTDLPDGLREYYRRHWDAMQRRGREVFDKEYEPVVCILGAVREAVSEEQVAEWTRLEPSQVRRVIRDWREFLYEERGKGKDRLWRIYHTTFQEYLMEEVDPDLRRYHAMIARSALAKIGKLKPQPA